MPTPYAAPEVRRVLWGLSAALLLLACRCTPLKADIERPDPDASGSGGAAGAAASSTTAGGRTTGASTSSSDVAASTVTGSGGAGGARVEPDAGGVGGGWPGDAGEKGGAGGIAERDAIGGTGGVVEIALGGAHACALLDGGRVRCWGWGLYGALGYGKGPTEDVGDDETPASFGDVDVGGKVVHIAAGGSNTCAILEGGRLRCWGWGVFGGLGYGNVESVGDDETPAAAGDVDVGGKVVDVAVGETHTCAVLEGGMVRCWGQSLSGALGYANLNSIGDKELPASAGDVNVGGRVVQIAVGEDDTCARLDTGAVRCWGDGQAGQLGYGNKINVGDDEAPAWAGSVDIGGRALQVSAGQRSVCAVLEGGKVRCWGWSPNGQLGYGNTATIGDDEPPSGAGDVDIGGPVASLSCGYSHTCALLENGSVRCWGRNQLGQLGYGNTKDIGDDEVPRTAGDVDVGGKVLQIGAGGYVTCALLVGGRVRCWGSDIAGGLGYGRPLGGPIGDDETPASAGDVPVY